ncbi:Glutathione S-transferase F13, partial [Ancistrocladus abbreviatus]
MALKLYGQPMSTCAARVMTVLNEKLVDLELHPVDLFAGEHRKLDFLSKNPFGFVPILEDGDLTLF